MKTELKPCPFCGSTEVNLNKCTKRVWCKKCHASSGLITPFIQQGMTEEEATLAAWNRREDAKIK